MTQALANVEYRPTEIGTERLGQILVKSGFFKDLREEAQAVAKILYGRELGFGPMASVMGVYIVDGRPSLSAQLIASAIQSHPAYRYRVREWTAKACRIEFFERGESLGESSFTIEEAATAGLSGRTVWKQYPKAMLWARAMSQGARAYAAEIFSGAIYTPEELGAEVGEDGRVVVIDELPGSLPFVPTRLRDVEDRTGSAQPTEQPAREPDTSHAGSRGPTVDAALEKWREACAWAAKHGIEHKDMPEGAPLRQVEKWTDALNEKIDAAEAKAQAEVEARREEEEDAF